MYKNSSNAKKRILTTPYLTYHSINQYNKLYFLALFFIQKAQNTGKQEPSPFHFLKPSDHSTQIVGIFLPNLLIILEKIYKHFPKNN